MEKVVKDALAYAKERIERNGKAMLCVINANIPVPNWVKPEYADAVIGELKNEGYRVERFVNRYNEDIIYAEKK